MNKFSATAIAHPNIAFIKYWGIKNNKLTLPVNGSISMNLANLESKTKVEFSSDFSVDQLYLNNNLIEGDGLSRVIKILDHIRSKSNLSLPAKVTSNNNFPTGSGIASSASGFAALALSASKAAGLDLNQDELSCIARLSSGSASRSIPGGFVEWYPGTNHRSSYSVSIAHEDHWGIADCIAIVSEEHKSIGSQSGHQLAPTSPLQNARIEDTQRRLDICREAILKKDFLAFANIMEADSNIMHAVMMSSTPNLFYWDPTTLLIMKSVQEWRNQGLAVSYTIDAGPNVHVICLKEDMNRVKMKLEEIPGILKVLTALPGGSAKIIS